MARSTYYEVTSKGETFYACRNCTDTVCDRDHGSTASPAFDGRRKCAFQFDGCADAPTDVWGYDFDPNETHVESNGMWS